MPSRPPRRSLAVLTLGALLGGAAAWIAGRAIAPSPPAAPTSPGHASAPQGASDPADLAALLPAHADASADAMASLAERFRDRLNRPGHRADEAVFTFKDAAAYRRFLERARGAGLEVLGRIDSLHAVRVRIGDYAGLVGELVARSGDYSAVTTNPVLAAPTPPPKDRAARAAAPVGENLLAVLGLAPGTDTSALGRGVLVAVLDGGASPDASLGARLRYQDIGYGVTSAGADGAHGTAVASLVAAVAPAADLLSIRVTGADGASDAFSVAQGIHAALDAGARVINVSLGGYATSPILTDAVERAVAAGVSLVASSGNDQAARLVWPAAYEGVVSVGATDAAGVQAIFSNSGAGLQLTAPGVGLVAAGPAGTRTSFSGTSASAPVVAAAAAALLSQSPGLTPQQAADLLAAYSNDGGAAGPDPDYGRGTVNLGWALDRDNPSRSDAAVSSMNYDAAAGALSIVVQNRGAQPLAGLGLDIQVGGAVASRPLPALEPGASATVTAPVDRSAAAADGSVVVGSRLSIPPSVTDQNSANNGRGGVLTLPAR